MSNYNKLYKIMNPYKINITIMSRNGEAEILDKQILVDDLDSLNRVDYLDGACVIANPQIYDLVEEALRNEHEEGLDVIDEYDETDDYKENKTEWVEDLTKSSDLNNPTNFV